MEKLVYVPKRRTLPAPALEGGERRARVYTEPCLVVELPWGSVLRLPHGELKERPEALEEVLSDLEGLGVNTRELRRRISATPFRAFLRHA